MKNEDKAKEDIPFIKYPDKGPPITWKYFFPVGTIADDVKEIIGRGLIDQARLWDAYSGCSRDIIITMRKL